MPYYPRFTMAWEGARTWALSIEQDRDTEPDEVVELFPEYELLVEGGDEAGEGWGGRRIPSSIVVRVHDPDDALAVLEGADESEWRAVLTGAARDGDGGVRWRGRPKIELFDRAVYRETAREPATLHLTDGLGGRQGRKAVVNDDPDALLTIGDLLAALTEADALDAPIRAVQGRGRFGGGVPLLDDLRLRPFVIADTGGAADVIDPWEDASGVPVESTVQMEELAQAFDCIWFQAITAPFGGAAEGAFCFAHPYVIGEAVSDDAAQLREPGGAFALEPWDYGLAAEVDEEAADAPGRRRKLVPPSAVVVTRKRRAAPPGAEAGVTADPAFDAWSTDPTPVPTVWHVVAGPVTQVTPGYETAYAAQFPNGGHARTDGPEVAQGVALDGKIRAMVAADAVGTSGPVLAATLQLIHPVLGSYWLERVGGVTWWTAPGGIGDWPDYADWLPLLRSGETGVTGTVDTYYELLTENLGGRTPAAGHLRLHLYSGDYLARVDSAELVLSEVVVTWPRGYDVATSPALYRHPALHVETGLGVFGEQHFETHAGAGEWVPVEDWFLDEQGPLTLYPDLLVAAAQTEYEWRGGFIGSNPATSPGDRLALTLDGIYPPERAFTLGGQDYRVTAYRLDCLRERTAVVAVPIVKRWGPSGVSIVDAADTLVLDAAENFAVN